MQINRIVMLVVGVMSTSAVLAQDPQGQLTIKCWMNDDEVRECASVIPPEFAARGYEIMSYDGTVLKKVAPEKTKEEIALIKSKEKAQMAEKAAEELKKKEDEALLKRYPTENDMRIALESKLDSIRAAIQVNRDQIEYFEQDLEQTKTAMKNSQEEQQSISNARAKKQLEGQNESLQGRISDIQEQITKFEVQISKKEQERQEAQAKFDGELERYRQIRWR